MKLIHVLLGWAFMGVALAQTQEAPKDPEAWAVATGMEGLFARQLVHSMRQTAMGEGLLETSPEAKFYRSMLDEEYADIISQRGELGIATIVYEYLKPSGGGVNHEN